LKWKKKSKYLDYIYYPTKTVSELRLIAMELCTRTFKTSLFFNPSFSLPSSSNSHLLRLNNTLKPFKFNSFNLSSFIQPSLYHHTSSPFTISASSSSSSPVELYSENDRLPAKLKVTETPESNSRVCSSFFTTIFAFTLSQIFFVLHCWCWIWFLDLLICDTWLKIEGNN
jgi:hypothetical protein